MLRVVILEGPVAGAMKINDDCHHLAQAQAGSPPSFSDTAPKEFVFKNWLELFAEVINFTEHVGECTHRGAV